MLTRFIRNNGMPNIAIEYNKKGKYRRSKMKSEQRKENEGGKKNNGNPNINFAVKNGALQQVEPTGCKVASGTKRRVLNKMLISLL